MHHNMATGTRFSRVVGSRTFATMAESLFKFKPIQTVDLVPGQLKKEIVQQGSGEGPKKGQMVTAHYTGKLPNGKDFDSSRSRGKPFQFKIGMGQVIQGWDTGIASMKKGERAVLTCAPDYAYGPDGYPPVIPENATLAFDVELIDFK